MKARLKDTNALLDLYIGMLDRSDAVTKLILDEKWQGASAVRGYLALPCMLSERTKRR